MLLFPDELNVIAMRQRRELSTHYTAVVNSPRLARPSGTVFHRIRNTGGGAAWAAHWAAQLCARFNTRFALLYALTEGA
jgi:hypothetical protein